MIKNSPVFGRAPFVSLALGLAAFSTAWAQPTASSSPEAELTIVSSEGCGPCRRLKSEMRTAGAMGRDTDSGEFVLAGHKVKVRTVDVDDPTIRKFRFRGTPAIVLKKGDDVLMTQVGYYPWSNQLSPHLASLLEKSTGSPAPAPTPTPKGPASARVCDTPQANQEALTFGSIAGWTAGGAIVAWLAEPLIFKGREWSMSGKFILGGAIASGAGRAIYYGWKKSKDNNPNPSATPRTSGANGAF